MSTRAAVWAGQFYPARKEALLAEIKRFDAGVAAQDKKKCLGIMAPHAGYMYSGHVAGAAYSRIEVPSRVLILGPKHRMPGAAIALSPDNEWETPLGNVQICADLNAEIMRYCPMVALDALAHVQEHSTEVHVPFVKYYNPSACISVIVMHSQDYSELRGLGEGIAEAVRALGRDVLIVASSDMSHFESQAATEKRDKLAIDRVLALDDKGLHDTVQENDISMCGYAPTVAMLAACRKLGAKEARLVKYATSGDVTGDYASVVGYASIIVT
jgi:hypothetical protein